MSFWLQTAYSATGLFNGVITSLPGWCQLDAKNSGDFVFSDLSGKLGPMKTANTATARQMSYAAAVPGTGCDSDEI
jgi:hypothetical protein